MAILALKWLFFQRRWIDLYSNIYLLCLCSVIDNIGWKNWQTNLRLLYMLYIFFTPPPPAHHPAKMADVNLHSPWQVNIIFGGEHTYQKCPPNDLFYTFSATKDVPGVNSLQPVKNFILFFFLPVTLIFFCYLLTWRVTA